jgi:PAS domain S-box-containing protein
MGISPYYGVSGSLLHCAVAIGNLTAEIPSRRVPDDVKRDIRFQLIPYMAGLGCVVIAFSLRSLLTPFIGDRAPLILFALAAMLAAWVGGLGPGLLAMAVGEIAGSYFFMRPVHNLIPSGVVEWIEFIVYFVVTATGVGILAALRRARRQATESFSLAQSRGEQLRQTVLEISQAESRLRQLSAVVEASGDAIVSVNLQGYITHWNKGAERLFGHGVSEMTGRSLVELVPLDRQEEYRAFCERIQRGETIAPFESVRVTKDGRAVEVLVSASPLQDESGNITGSFICMRDVVELKRAQSALRESEDRFRMLADATPLMIWMIDTDKCCTWVNRARLAFTGRTLAQDLGEGLLEPIHPEDLSRWQHAYNGACERLQPFEIEYRLRRQDGEYRWVLGQGVPHFGKGGSFLGYLGYCMDVTERKQADEALEKKFDELRSTQEVLRAQNEELVSSRQALELERSRYRELFDSAPVGYILTSQQGIIQKVNLTAANLLHETPEFLVGLPLARLLAREERAVFFANLGRLTRQEVPRIENWEASIQLRNLPPFPCSLLVNLVHDEANRLTGLRWILRDITERRLAEDDILKLNAELEKRVRDRTAALEAANRELEAFSYSVSHDLRAPLRSITGFSTALLEEYGDHLDEQGLKYLQFAREAGQRMTRLIEDLMDLSRATRGELRHQEVDLSALATLVVAELRKREPRRPIEIEIAPKLLAHGDEGLLRIALENLLGNAWKFTVRHPQPRIEVGAASREGSPLYFVRDNGAGFNMAHAGRLFGVFQRLHSQDEFPGTGIGLATVRRIFHRHGGEVWAEGKINEGATFYFTLPTVDQSQQEPSITPAQTRQCDGVGERLQQPVRSAAESEHCHS